MRPHLDDTAEISRYLQQVADHPILSRAEEVRLARIWARRNKKVPPTREQREAHERLIECNVKLVVSIAKQYRNRGLPFIEVIQEGILGLGRAIEGFDPEMGIKLSTYATWWIRQACQRAVSSQGATIRVPAHVNFRRARSYQLMEERPDITVEEIAKILECQPHHIEEALDVVRASYSLDGSRSDDTDASSVADAVADPHADDPADVLEQRDFMRSQVVQQVLARIGDEERAVIELRFGFNGVHPHSFAEVSKALKIPTHKCQALQKTALRKLERLLESDDFISHGITDDTTGSTERRGRAARAASSHTARQAPTSAPLFTYTYTELIEENVLGRCDCVYESDVHHHGEDIAC